MPSLNIEDFGSPFQKPNSDEMSKEEVEKFYQNRIKQLEKEFQKKIEESYQKGFSEGYKKAESEISQKLSQEFEKKLQEKLKEKESQQKSELEDLRQQVIKLLTEIHDRYKEHIQFTDELILSVLEEIMEYLFIDPSNLKFVSDEIEKIIEDLKAAPSITVEVSPQLKEFLGEVDSNIKIIGKEELKGGDFTVKIENVQFESRFKEKMKIVKDEIKREIKKNSPL
ncbi:FliH/SctL family protein [Persephonella sp.]